MDTEKVIALSKEIDLARERLAAAKKQLEIVKSHNGQSGYSVAVNGITIAVSKTDSRTYQGTLIRGREMIHLGAIKAVNAVCDNCEDNLKDAIKKLEDFVRGSV